MGQMILVGGNNITLSESISVNSATVTIIAPSSIVSGISLSGNTSGILALISSGTMTLAGGNNITLSQAGNAVTVSAPVAFSGGVSNLGNTIGTTGL